MGRGRHELPREVYGTAGESRGRCLRRWSRGWLPGRAAQGRSSTHVLEAVSVGPLMSHDNDQRKGAPSGPPARPSGSGRHWTPTEGPQVPGHAAASPAPLSIPRVEVRTGRAGEGLPVDGVSYPHWGPGAGRRQGPSTRVPRQRGDVVPNALEEALRLNEELRAVRQDQGPRP